MTIALDTRRAEPPRDVPDAGLARLFDASRERDRARVAASDAANLQVRAASLADDLFANDPEIAALRADRDAKQRRADRVGGGRCAIACVAAVSALEARVEAATAEQRLAAIDDALDGDDEFKRAVAIGERIATLRAQLDAAQMALGALTGNPYVVEITFRHQAGDAENALALALQARKREYLAQKGAVPPPVSAT